MLDEHTIAGYVLAALVLIFGFAAVILKISKPLQDLNINIVKLTTVMSFIVKEQDSLKETVKIQGKAIEDLHTQMTTLTTKVEDFEKRGP